MRTEWAGRLAKLLTGMAVVGVLSFGASEAIAAQEMRTTAACEEGTNWCAEGQQNCNDCCGPLGGFCTSFDPSPDQGCICWT